MRRNSADSSNEALEPSTASMPLSKALTMSLRSAPATNAPGLPEVMIAPLIAASVAMRSTAAARSAVSSGVRTFIGRPGTSMVRIAMPSRSMSNFSAVVMI